MNIAIEAIGAAAAAITTLCWLPQVLHILRTRETAGVSLTAFLALAGGNALWLVYGVLIASWPLIGANFVSLVLLRTIIGLKLRHRRAEVNPR